MTSHEKLHNYCERNGSRNIVSAVFIFAKQTFNNIFISFTFFIIKQSHKLSIKYSKFSKNSIELLQ